MEQIKFKLSQSNLPYLEFPNLGLISFVNWSKTNEGYKHLNFSFNHGYNITFMTNMDLKITGKQGDNKKDIKRLGLQKTIDKLKDIFGKLVTKDGIFPYKNIDKLKKQIEGIEFETREKEVTKLKRVKDKKVGFLKHERKRADKTKKIKRKK